MTRAKSTLLLIAVVSLLAASGCHVLRRDEAAPPQKSFWQRILPTQGEYFYNERSREIDRNLERNNGVSI